MKTLFFGLLLIAGGILILSCEKDSNLETPKYNPHLVMHSFISPQDTILYVHIGATRNLYGPLRDFQKNLPVSVSLFDGDKEVSFNKSDTADIYFAHYSVKAGKEYKVTARCTGYPSITAYTKIPEERIFDISIDTTSERITHEWGNFIQYMLAVKFSDIPGEKNFYNIYALERTKQMHGTYISTLYPVQKRDEYNYNREKFHSDYLTDGQVILSNYSYYLHKDTFTYSQEIEANVLHTDEAYYKYHISMRNYSGTDDPFTEFSPVYSNVQGGYGVFASYVRYNKVLKLK